MSNSTVNFATLQNGTQGIKVEGVHTMFASSTGNYASDLDADLYVQFSESGFSNFTHTYALPIRSRLRYNYTTGGGGTPPGIEN